MSRLHRRSTSAYPDDDLRYDRPSYSGDDDDDDRGRAASKENKRHSLRARSKSLGRRALSHMQSAFMRGRGPQDSPSAAPSHHRRPSHGPRKNSSYYTDDENARRTRRSPSHSRAPSQKEALHQGIIAAVDAAAFEAWRVRKEPGSWMGAKGKRVATAALMAAAVESARARGDRGGGSRKERVGSAVAGLVVNRLVNGSRRELEGKRRR